VRDTLTEVPLVLQAKDGHLAALMGAYGEAGSDLAGHVRRLEAPDSKSSPASSTARSRFRPTSGKTCRATDRPPGEVWPAEAAV